MTKLFLLKRLLNVHLNTLTWVTLILCNRVNSTSVHIPICRVFLNIVVVFIGCFSVIVHTCNNLALTQHSFQLDVFGLPSTFS